MKRLAIILTLAAVPANAYSVRSGYDVNGDASSFTVEYKPGSAAREYWCAAGEFVQRALSAPPSTRIYRVSPRPLARGEGMTFSLSPENAVGYSGMAVFPDSGDLSAAFAESFCEKTMRPDW